MICRRAQIYVRGKKFAGGDKVGSARRRGALKALNAEGVREGGREKWGIRGRSDESPRELKARLKYSARCARRQNDEEVGGHERVKRHL